jgi:hypothetical protein
MWKYPGNIYIAHSHMNVKIGAEAALFPEKEYINRIAVAVWIRIQIQKDILDKPRQPDRLVVHLEKSRIYASKVEEQILEKAKKKHF